MLSCDFGKSYVFIEVDHDKAITVTAKQPIKHNQIRIPLECRCEVTAAGVTSHFTLSASCKTEKVAVERDIWMIPNADFCVVSSSEDFLIIKRWQQCGLHIERESPEMAAHQERQVGKCGEAWATHRQDLEMVEARALTSNREIVEAVLAKRPLVSRTEFHVEDGCRVLLEYPVKTINVSDRAGNYQVDTGPVLYPDLEIGHERFIGNFRLAFVAHNCPDWAEFIVNEPTPIRGGADVQGGADVHHYSRPARVNCTNTVLELV